RGEYRVIRIIRAYFSAICLIGIILFAFFEMIINPIRESQLVPTKEYHSKYSEFGSKSSAPVWGIVAYMGANNILPDAPGKLEDAVTVTPLWDESFENPPPCQTLLGYKYSGQYYNDNNRFNPSIRAITIFCPSAKLLVSVNFSMLGIPDNDRIGNTQKSTVLIAVGLTNDTRDVIRDTLPTPLSPGLHVLGAVRQRIRQRLNSGSLSFLGLFTSSRTFVVGDIVSLTPDPSTSAIIPRGPGMASLRIHVLFESTDWTISQEYREKTVWSGFATLGGFWTSISSGFAFLFGATLLLVTFGKGGNRI
ncbi:hypothetical protein BDQ12DRAFT_618618, partial [Crucibulum laeve]